MLTLVKIIPEELLALRIVGRKLYLNIISFFCIFLLLLNKGYSDNNNYIFHVREAGATPCKNIRNIFTEPASEKQTAILQWTGGFISASSYNSKVLAMRLKYIQRLLKNCKKILLN